MSIILTFTPNPAVDKTLFHPRLTLGGRYRIQRYECVAGGKGVNVARVLHGLGAPVKACVILGGHTGEHVCEMMQREGIPTHVCACEAPTRTITTVYEEELGRQTVFFEPGPVLDEKERARIFGEWESILEQARLVTLNGTMPCAGMETVYEEMVHAAHRRSIPVLLDSHGEEFRHGVNAKPFLIKPNREELEELVQRRLLTDNDVWESIEALHDMGIEWIVITDGARGAYVRHDNYKIRAYPPAVQEVNAVGSGDALLAYLVWGILNAWDLERTVRTAVAAGAANARQWDVCRFSPAEVEELAEKVHLDFLK